VVWVVTGDEGDKGAVRVRRYGYKGRSGLNRMQKIGSERLVPGDAHESEV
jgi:hypothetical protein